MELEDFKLVEKETGAVDAHPKDVIVSRSQVSLPGSLAKKFGIKQDASAEEVYIRVLYNNNPPQRALYFVKDTSETHFEAFKIIRKTEHKRNNKVKKKASPRAAINLPKQFKNLHVPMGIYTPSRKLTDVFVWREELPFKVKLEGDKK